MAAPQPLSAIIAGSNILLDANVLIYATSDLSGECAHLVQRCHDEEVSGFTTAEAVGEACHRLMIAEAYGRDLIKKPNAAALKGKKHIVVQLSHYWAQVATLFASNILVLELDERRIRRAQTVREQHGLMTNDSTILAAAMELGIDSLATNDADFEGIPGITVYRPTDV